MYAGSAALEGVTVDGGIASTLASAPSNLPLCEQFSTFQSYLKSLPFAIQQLLQDLDIRIPVPELIQLLNSTHPQLSAPLQCIGVSDGSENQGSMTFGWLIADPEGFRVAACAGPAFGSQASSYRAEGYGFVSLSLFLLHLRRYSSATPDWSFTLVSDNLGLVTK
eukprot:scaffold21320_cov78-Cylindrotheca_fusiformis.AAC.1